MKYFKVKIINNIGCCDGLSKGSPYRSWYYDRVGEIYTVYLEDIEIGDDEIIRVYSLKDSGAYINLENAINLDDLRIMKLNSL
ncbi:hypothetical protein M0Q50_03340 [bacterium]|jgi:hypothetical protein|nr:hypothetical protein [bacterium]